VRVLHSTTQHGTALSILLIKSYIFIGILGNLIPLTSALKSIRFYHLLLPVIVVYFLRRKLRIQEFKIIIVTFPLVLYLLISAIYASYVDSESIPAFSAQNPLIRFALLYFLFISTVLISSDINRKTIDFKFDLILLYLKGFLITAVVGIFFFVGYYVHLLSVDFILKFQVQVQFGAGGLLRISPGSYPNEYGTVSSFALSVITLLFINKKQLLRERILFITRTQTAFYVMCWILSITVLFLATTRSAYISFVLSLIFISYTQKARSKKVNTLLKMIALFVIVYVIVQRFLYDIKSIFVSGFNSFVELDGSTGSRIEAWMSNLKYFSDNPMFGVGFGRLLDTHNYYLQLLCEIGLTGLILFAITFVIIRNIHLGKKSIIEAPQTIKYELLSKVKSLAILHVLWFATNNHNLNHHLTWFCVMLILISTPMPKRSYNEMSICNTKTKGGEMYAG
jgi:O-antigen ligase